jgi:ElaB/YqjD/DUF883 family membrane-anchored ribosome-binding protein
MNNRCICPMPWAGSACKETSRCAMWSSTTSWLYNVCELDPDASTDDFAVCHCRVAGSFDVAIVEQRTDPPFDTTELLPPEQNLSLQGTWYGSLAIFMIFVTGVLVASAIVFLALRHAASRKGQSILEYTREKSNNAREGLRKLLKNAREGLRKLLKNAREGLRKLLSRAREALRELRNSLRERASSPLRVLAVQPKWDKMVRPSDATAEPADTSTVVFALTHVMDEAERLKREALAMRLHFKINREAARQMYTTDATEADLEEDGVRTRLEGPMPSPDVEDGVRNRIEAPMPSPERARTEVLQKMNPYDEDGVRAGMDAPKSSVGGADKVPVVDVKKPVIPRAPGISSDTGNWKALQASALGAPGGQELRLAELKAAVRLQMQELRSRLQMREAMENPTSYRATIPSIKSAFEDPQPL